MCRLLMFIVLSATAACGSARAELVGPSSQLGFGYCSPPVVPTCIERNAQPTDRPGLAACSREVLRFTQTLGAYRGCLTRESERAIGTGNAAIARFRCLTEGRHDCP